MSDILGYSLSISNYQSQDIKARPSNIRFAMKNIKRFNIFLENDKLRTVLLLINLGLHVLLRF